MNFLKYLFFIVLFPLSLNAEILTFSPNSNIEANQMNNNFMELKNILELKGFDGKSIPNNFISGEVIKKESLDQNFEMLLNSINTYEDFNNLISGGLISSSEINDTFNSAKLVAQSSTQNFYGDGSDGDLTISSDTELSVPNKNGSYDGEIVVRQYNNLTVNATLTTDHPGRGLLIYVKGDLNISSSGKISMTARGAFVNPDSVGVNPTGLVISKVTVNGTESNIQSDLSGTGSNIDSENQSLIIKKGKNFIIPNAGAGGNGGQYNRAGGSGALGTVFSGGAGGGGAYGPTATAGGNAQAFGGAGGNSGSGGSMGAGNPSNGTGGLLIIIVRGNIVNDGIIESEGSQSPIPSVCPDNNWRCASGGASGGGNILILHGGNLSNNGTISIAGGVNPDYDGVAFNDGAPGEDGNLIIESILP